MMCFNVAFTKITIGFHKVKITYLTCVTMNLFCFMSKPLVPFNAIVQTKSSFFFEVRIC